MLEIVLYQPEIPPNTGNILRLAANTGSRLHLVRPLGFQLHDRALKRSGLDYGDISNVLVHADWNACLAHFGERRMLAVSTRGTQLYNEFRYAAEDVLLFGPETRGLPLDVLASLPANQCIRLPMAGASRSLNLSNAVAVVTYEAWRQLGFHGAAPAGRLTGPAASLTECPGQTSGP